MKSISGDSVSQDEDDSQAKEEWQPSSHGKVHGNKQKKNTIPSPVYDTNQGKTDSSSKKCYIKLSKENILELKQFYSKNPYPNRQELGLFAKKFDFSFLKVENWFKHKRRTQIKKGQLENPKKKIFSKKELLILKKNLINCKRPSPEKYEELAQQLNCSLKNVKNWYYKRKRYIKMDAARQANEAAKTRHKIQKTFGSKQVIEEEPQDKETEENKLESEETIEKVSESSTKVTNGSPSQVTANKKKVLSNPSSPSNERLSNHPVLIPNPLKIFTKQQIKEEYPPMDVQNNSEDAEIKGHPDNLEIMENGNQLNPEEREERLVGILHNCYRKIEEQEGAIQHYRYVVGNLMNYIEECERKKATILQNPYYNFKDAHPGFGNKFHVPDASLMSFYNNLNSMKNGIYSPRNINFPMFYGRSMNL